MYGRFTTGPPSVVRKPRVDGKQSLLPKPRRPGSTDRASVDARRPSTSIRSSSAEPARATLAGGRPSREASATKIPTNRRSRSQQAERFGQSSMTPLRSAGSSQYGARTTTTPMRTPSEDRLKRSWQTSLDRALAFVTIKDQRPITTMAWQRAEAARVGEALLARGGGWGAALTLIRPLTITRFVDICAGLLQEIKETKLNNDNYVAKLPNLAKRFLYPGTVSKSWLKTVNTLHAFPQALAFIAYLLDLVDHMMTPVSDDWLYLEKDELACIRRDFVHKCWVRFQEPGCEFEDLDVEYLQRLKQLLGNDERRVVQLQDEIQQLQSSLEDEAELAARAEEERVRSRRDALRSRLHAIRAERATIRTDTQAQKARAHDQRDVLRQLDNDIAGLTAENQQLKRELETQDMSVSERTRLLEEVDYATRCIDSKRALAENIAKTTLAKETELAHWQQRALSACVDYKQMLIQLCARCPQLAKLAIDEQQLMEEQCAVAMCRAVEELRALHAELSERRAQCERARAKTIRQRHHQQEQARAKIAELKSLIARKQQDMDADNARDAADAAAWVAKREQLADALRALAASEDDYQKAQNTLEFWEKQDVLWRTRLAEMREYTANLREQLKRDLESEKKERADVVLDLVSSWHLQLDRVEAEERALEAQAKGAGDL